MKTTEITERHDLAVEEPEDDELLGYRTHQLKAALEEVDPKDKMILLMKYQDGISIKDIMDQLNISESAVKMRLSRARKRVKSIIVELEKAEGYV